MSRCLIPRSKVDLAFYKPHGTVRALLSPIPITRGRESSANMADLITMPISALRVQMPSFMHNTIQMSGLTTITVKFMWPGYEKYEFLETISVKGMSNGQVAVAVAFAYQDLLIRALKVSGADPRYALHPGSHLAKLQNLYMRTLIHVHSDIFVVEVEHAPLKPGRDMSE
ncbi:hypothetical protein C2E23DRAFT_493818 [Lenzites betulinus]|nr:hypothetical protein C2E23DRAFT_493818 [Lenzites betulinus]